MNKQQNKEHTIRQIKALQQRKRYFAILFTVLFVLFPAILFWVFGTTDSNLKYIPFWGLSIALPLWIIFITGLWFILYKFNIIETKSIAFIIPFALAAAGIIWSYQLELWARGLISLGCVLSTLIFLFISTHLEERNFQKNFDQVKSGKVK
ncbi:MAG3450 family membrane protein [Mycoplasmopsis alligatoris]|uniref:MAG3450 family membrane protein n=1 Tax=Mycoplasmopsis alligatoris TaxID=47687 RepID=UPI00030D1F43|nr:hypothetical protein [Mycoplasmopsis alligatoris]